MPQELEIIPPQKTLRQLLHTPSSFGQFNLTPNWEQAASTTGQMEPLEVPWMAHIFLRDLQKVGAPDKT